MGTFLKGIGAQIVTMISVKFDDVSKISMYKASDILVTFIIQYFMFPEIKPNVLKYVGAGFITAGMVLIMSFKLIDSKRQKRLELDKELGIHSKRPGCLTKFIFFKV